MDHGRMIAIGDTQELKDRFQEKTLEDLFISLTGEKVRE
jgi:hypothetical protein